MTRVTDHQPSEGAQPGNQARDRPAPRGTPQRAAGLSARRAPVAPLRRTQRDPLSAQARIQRVTVGGAIRDPVRRHLRRAAGRQGGRDHGHCMGARTGDADGEWQPSAVGPCYERRPVAPLGLSHPIAPCCAATTVPCLQPVCRQAGTCPCLLQAGAGQAGAGSNATRGALQAAALLAVAGHGPHDRRQPSRAHPALAAAVARLGWRLSRRHVVPRCTGPQQPADAMQHVPRCLPRTPPLMGRRAVRRGQTRLQDGPLVIGEVHSSPRSSW